MDKLLFFSIFILFAIVYFLVGYWVSRSIKSIDDYYLAHRDLGIFPLTISLIATQLGGGFILGTSAKSWQMGYFGVLYVIGICLGFFLLASGIAAKLRSFEVATTAEIFEVAYDSVFLKKIASLCSIFSLIGIFAAQVIASKSLLIALDVFNPTIFIIFWILIIFYTMIGGLQAIVKNDVIQLSLIILVFVGLFFWDFFTNVSLSSNVLSSFDSFTNDYWDIAQVATVILVPALYSLIEQDLAQVFFAAKTPRIAIIGAFSAAIFLMFFSIVPLYFGMKTKIMGIPLTLEANPLMSYFAMNYNNTILAIVTYGVLAAIISTANAVLCAISGNLVQDFKINKLALNQKRGLFISKVITLSVGIIGLILSFLFTDLIKLLVDSYAIPVAALFIPLIYAYFSKKNSKLAAMLSVWTGLCVYLILIISNTKILIIPVLDALLLSAIAFALGLLLDQKKLIKI